MPSLRRWWRRRKIEWTCRDPKCLSYWYYPDYVSCPGCGSRKRVMLASSSRAEPAYRGYHIGHEYAFDPPRVGDWTYVHADWDLDDERKRNGWAKTFKECLDLIDELEEDRKQ